MDIGINKHKIRNIHIINMGINIHPRHSHKHKQQHAHKHKDKHRHNHTQKYQHAPIHTHVQTNAETYT